MNFQGHVPPTPSHWKTTIPYLWLLFSDGSKAVNGPVMLLPPLFIFPLLSGIDVQKLWLPWYSLLPGLLLPAAFLLSYLIAVYLGHTHWGWPYISDTTTRWAWSTIQDMKSYLQSPHLIFIFSPPESCIFSQLVNIAVLFVTATIYIRYKQVVLSLEKLKYVSHSKCSYCRLSTILGGGVL